MGIIARTKGGFTKIKSIWSHRKLIGLAVVFLIGLVLICSAALVLKGTTFVIALIIGGVLIIISWIKMVFDAAVKRAIQVQEGERIKEENRQLKENESVLKQQLEEARNRKLQVLNVQPILELGILEAEYRLSRCFDFSIDEKGKVSDGSESKSRYYVTTFLRDLIGRVKFRFIGMLTINFSARYGVEMENLRVRVDDEAKVVYVEGAEPSYLGIKGFPKSSWESGIVLRERAYERWAADDISSQLEGAFKDHCRDYVEESLENGPEELDWLKQPLQNTVKHLLQMMIAPPGYSLVFVDKIEEESMPFFEYAARLGLDKPRLGGGDN